MRVPKIGVTAHRRQVRGQNPRQAVRPILRIGHNLRGSAVQSGVCGHQIVQLRPKVQPLRQTRAAGFRK